MGRINKNMLYLYRVGCLQIALGTIPLKRYYTVYNNGGFNNIPSQEPYHF